MDEDKKEEDEEKKSAGWREGRERTGEDTGNLLATCWGPRRRSWNSMGGLRGRLRGLGVPPRAPQAESWGALEAL